MTLLSTQSIELSPSMDIVFCEGLSKEEWFEFHRKLKNAKKYATKWIKQSLDFAEEAFGEEFAYDSDATIDLDLFGEKIEPLKLNPPDKSTAIVTIEGISQQFALWHRKMDSEIAGWDKPKIEKALGLLEPIEKEAKRLRWMLDTI